jgi:hypothetical protein
MGPAECRLANLPSHLASLIWEHLDEQSRRSLMQVSSQVQLAFATAITSVRTNFPLRQSAKTLWGRMGKLRVRKLALAARAADAEQTKKSLAIVSAIPQFSRVRELHIKVGGCHVQLRQLRISIMVSKMGFFSCLFHVVLYPAGSQPVCRGAPHIIAAPAPGGTSH